MTEEFDNQMKGSPMEEVQAKAERLRQFQGSVGYKDLVEATRDQEANLMRMFLSDDPDVDLQQLRADFRAWHKLVQLVDEPIQQYDFWLEQTLKQMRVQEDNSHKGAYNGR